MLGLDFTLGQGAPTPSKGGGATQEGTVIGYLNMPNIVSALENAPVS